MKLVNKIVALSAMALCSNLVSQAQADKCGNPKRLQQLLQQNPNLHQQIDAFEVATQDWISKHGNEKTRATLTIPVVVHVIYNTSAQNITDAQVQSQIDVLNRDYNMLNTDTLQHNNTGKNVFWTVAGKANLHFCLAHRDPNGNATSGIRHVNTSLTGFDPNSTNDDMKFTANGGDDAWSTSQYLNIWVVNFTGTSGTLGYTQPPANFTSWPAYDGVVIGYEYFGYMGSSVNPIDLGRTTTHEIGHWMNLEHPWGDGQTVTNCGDDFVADTPPCYNANFGCPSFPVNTSCNTSTNGEMFNNFMDYPDDACMDMFTKGQVARMLACLNTLRTGVTANSAACNYPLSIGNVENAALTFGIYPNPAKAYFTITDVNDINATYKLINVMGQTIAKGAINGDTQVNTTGLPIGTYIVSVQSKNAIGTQKIVIAE